MFCFRFHARTENTPPEKLPRTVGAARVFSPRICHPCCTLDSMSALKYFRVYIYIHTYASVCTRAIKTRNFFASCSSALLRYMFFFPFTAAGQLNLNFGNRVPAILFLFFPYLVGTAISLRGHSRCCTARPPAICSRDCR